ncbi:MAG: hypothetical protein QOJ67_1705 [Acidimicrobiaceae bacterium]|jgi:uncharacterized protein YqgV (UPF0045/DUF77 family)
MTLRVEFTVEPFVEGSPGPHVDAAVAAAREHGLEVDFGPFGTTIEGDDSAVLAAIDAVVRAAMSTGASRVSVQVSRAG